MEYKTDLMYRLLLSFTNYKPFGANSSISTPSYVINPNTYPSASYCPVKRVIVHPLTIIKRD